MAQDTFYVLWHHRLFAASEMCRTPALMDAAGPFAHLHCAEHLSASDTWRLSSVCAAFAEANGRRLIVYGLWLLLSPFVKFPKRV